MKNFEERVHAVFPIQIPPKYKNYISNINSIALNKQFLPHIEELNTREGLEDPIGDKVKMKTSRLIHRYENRVLFFPTDKCPIHCRYCFRKNELNQSEQLLFKKDIDETLNYIKEQTSVNEIIFSGGDPFSLPDSKLEFYLKTFSTYEHITHIRFHSRFPIVAPERLNSNLLELLYRFSDRFHLSIAIHANHRDEFTQDAIRLIQSIDLNKVQLLSQSVLLKGVNDNSQALGDLFKTFNSLKVQAYYLHHPDKVKGAMHFYLSKAEGVKIYKEVRSKMSGFQIPRYVIDDPNATGKEEVFEKY